MLFYILIIIKKDDLIFSVQFYLRQLLYLLKEIQFLNFMYFLVLEISSSLLKHAITQDAVMITMNRKIEWLIYIIGELPMDIKSQLP